MFFNRSFYVRQKKVCELSLKIINKLNLHNIRCTVLTKGIYPQEIANSNGFSKKNEYGITLVSLSDTFKKKYEPNASSFLERIESLRFLSGKGFKTWASIEPYPTPNIIDQDLTEILESVSFVDKIIFGRLNYSVKATDFKHIKEFYNSLAKSVIRFCKKNKIKHHIKQGTQV